MRAGYLSALAARTLGVTPMLRPATPSRFEPEGAQGELREVVEVHEAEPIPSAPARPAPRRVDEQPVGIDIEADRPGPGLFGSGFPDERVATADSPDGWEEPDVSELAGEPAEAAGRRRPGVPLPSRTADLEPLAYAETPTHGSLPHPGQTAGRAASLDEGPPAQADLAVTATPPLEAPGSRAAWHVDVIQTGRSRPQAQAADPAGEPAGAPGSEPVIVVHIGRVDVRAVQAAPSPAPAPRPRPPAGPSLAEHLLARDRRRR